MELLKLVKEKLKAFNENKKAQIIALVIVLIVAALVAGFVLFHRKQNINATNNSNSSKASVNSNSNLNTSSGKNIFPIAVVVENLTTARPYQAGLADADIVYETLAEGGITRFLLVFTQKKSLDKIGPIRSARAYFVDWAEEYSGFFAHIGGSPQALGVLNSNDYLTDLNQFYNSQYFWRDSGIEAPHNVFSSSELFSRAVRDKIGENASGDYENWLTKKNEVKVAERPTGEKYIKINFSSDSYFVEYKYDKENNSYSRYLAGVAHKDASGNQIVAKNVIIQYVDTSLLEANTGRLSIKTIGEGKAVVFVDGKAAEGTWKKENRGDRTKFFDANNNEIKLNQGNTWVEAVPTDQNIEYN